MPPPPIIHPGTAGRRRSDSSGACRGKGQPVLGADLNCSESSWRGAWRRAGRCPSRESKPVSLEVTKCFPLCLR
jgi:hypothetical protein